MRRMERGFYVSLDREMPKRRARATSARSRTASFRCAGCRPSKPSEFHGVELTANGSALPLGFVMSKKHLRTRSRTSTGGSSAAAPGYHHLLRDRAEVEHGARLATPWTRRCTTAPTTSPRIEARAKPAEVGDDEKWLDIDLGAQSLVAYVGASPVFATLMSRAGSRTSSIR